MKLFLTFLLYLGCIYTIVSQEEKDSIPQDSLKRVLKTAIQELLQDHSNTIRIKTLKEILTELTPKKKKQTVPEGWVRKGKFDLVFNQSAFNVDWQGGGTSNIAGNTSVYYDFNYKKNALTWDTKIATDFGLTLLKDESFSRKTSDRIELNSILGLQIKNSLWYFSLFANFRSQFAKGYRYEKDAITEETIRIEETHFFSPAFIQVGPGLLWKKSNDININIAPVTSRMIFVNNKFTSEADYEDGSYFGVESNKNSRFEFGGSVSTYIKLTVFKNITLENTLHLYSNYIEDPLNIDIDYVFNLSLIFNKYISGSAIFQAIYDDNATSGFQIREVVGLGLNYAF